MELNELKEYLRIEGEDEDITLSSLLFAAKSYIKNGTGLEEDMIKNNEILELYKLCLKLLISHWYENRAIETTGPNFHKLSFSMDSILIQLEAEYLKIKRSEIDGSRQTY
ncbi:head-tail connector protein [Clostridium botulinum]|uniref:Phage gp6-like head-tail connector protein n=1 Tax=Clostridium botulinum TaxID=1491 RepID=A0A6G4H4S5_CLOBO|nr:head-tail connector protein [Clostridium botulinum]MBY6842254.1 phage gp6-like head-tail connector protein [Clostridium botulinum]MBY6844497.1 phage gp6-like head-tail connector protein [Clostridium botulinum]NFH35956.1 phage gp6-like head-tail connector protein [Clostridium botulinum]NFU28489.1 phage gp6-like head-tail connector protein [Clostridium botulinum]NFV06973.1 phage gp6-like head-tail connector protein [Clostridium botulinum]